MTFCFILKTQPCLGLQTQSLSFSLVPCTQSWYLCKWGMPAYYFQLPTTWDWNVPNNPVTGLLLPADQTYLFIWNPEYLLSQNSLSVRQHVIFCLASDTNCLPMIQLAICQCALPMTDLACPVLLKLTLCPLVVLDTCLFLSADPGHHRTQARHEPFPLSRMLCYITGLKNSATLETKLGKAQPCVVSPLRVDQRITCSLHSGIVNLHQRLLSPSSRDVCVMDFHFTSPSSLLVSYHGFSSSFSIHKVLVELTQTPGLALANQSNTTHLRPSDCVRNARGTQAGPMTVLPENDRDAFCWGY